MKTNSSDEYVSPSIKIYCVKAFKPFMGSPGAGGSEGTGEEELPDNG